MEKHLTELGIRALSLKLDYTMHRPEYELAVVLQETDKRKINEGTNENGSSAGFVT